MKKDIRVHVDIFVDPAKLLGFKLAKTLRASDWQLLHEDELADIGYDYEEGVKVHFKEGVTIAQARAYMQPLINAFPTNKELTSIQFEVIEIVSTRGMRAHALFSRDKMAEYFKGEVGFRQDSYLRSFAPLHVS